MVAALSSLPAAAVEFDWNGYASLVGARVISGEEDEPTSYVYRTSAGKRWSIRDESRFGLQGRAYLTPELTATGQLTGHAGDKFVDPLRLDIFSLRWTPVPQLSLTAGRQRLPQFAYSNYMQVGHAIPWVRPIQNIYGTDVENYDGIEALGRLAVGAIDFEGAAFGGRFTDRKKRVDGVETEGVTSRLKDIQGVWTSAQWGDLEIRYSYERHDTSYVFVDDAGDYRSKSSSWSINYVSSSWVVRGELLKIHFQDPGTSGLGTKSQMLGVGYQVGRWLPMATWSRYVVRAEEISEPMWTLSLRYDVNRNVAVKAQLDQIKRFNPDPGSPFVNRILSVSVDTSF